MITTVNRILVPGLEAFCLEAMRRSGLADEDARLTAEVLVTTDTWGTFTHGTRHLRGLLKNMRAGRLDVAAGVEAVAEGPAWAMVDGHYIDPARFNLNLEAP